MCAHGYWTLSSRSSINHNDCNWEVIRTIINLEIMRLLQIRWTPGRKVTQETYAKIHRKILPTNVTACAVGALSTGWLASYDPEDVCSRTCRVSG